MFDIFWTTNQQVETLECIQNTQRKFSQHPCRVRQFNSMWFLIKNPCNRTIWHKKSQVPGIDRTRTTLFITFSRRRRQVSSATCRHNSFKRFRSSTAENSALNVRSQLRDFLLKKVKSSVHFCFGGMCLLTGTSRWTYSDLKWLYK